MIENRCRNCKHLDVIVSQTSDYYCYKKHSYMNSSDFIKNCEDFVEDTVSLIEKEEKGW